ncbi:pentapeptide repeat-containing protein [Streptosporangium canum]|uniref:pentapeptide repeat-containing protein n=1 Tax=Streptosporangium canum TaxID=324952 RepID=UPI00341F8369
MISAFTAPGAPRADHARQPIDFSTRSTGAEMSLPMCHNDQEIGQQETALIGWYGGMRLPLRPRRFPAASPSPPLPLALPEPRPAAWWIVPAALLVGGTVTAVAWWLLGSLPPLKTVEEVTARQGALQIALGAGAGIGAAITVMLAFRRQRHQELTALITSRQTDRAAELADRVAEHNRQDAIERRVTELYTKAAEQLGSDKAAVRLAGLYSLERVAQDNPGHRQTIVNVLCAYLRMPYVPPPAPDPARDRPEALRAAQHRYQALRATRGRSTPPAEKIGATGTGQNAEGERQVRLTAQRILADHLRGGPPLSEEKTLLADRRFWGGMHLDLTGATLINLDFDYCHMAEAEFREANFIGAAGFRGATFAGYAGFTGATFTDHAQFTKAVFIGFAQFVQATFGQYAGFVETTFNDVQFWNTTFSENAEFIKTTFSRGTGFAEVIFSGRANFDGAIFSGGVELDGMVVTIPDVKNSWPRGWKILMQPDGTGRLSRVTDDSTPAS